MTGPQHYEAAERLATQSEDTSTRPEAMYLAYLADVHVNLARLAFEVDKHWGGAGVPWFDVVHAEEPQDG